MLESMFEWLVPPMLRVAMRMVRAPVPMQDLNLLASCMRLLDALLVPEFRDTPQLIADMNDNVQMVSQQPSALKPAPLCMLHSVCMSLCMCAELSVSVFLCTSACVFVCLSQLDLRQPQH